MKLVVSCKERFGGSRMARRRSQYISTVCIGDAVNSVDGIPNLKPNLIIILMLLTRLLRGSLELRESFYC